MSIGKTLKRQLLTGAIVLAPVGATLWLMYIMARFMVGVLHLGILPTSLVEYLMLPDWLAWVVSIAFEVANFLIGFIATLLIILAVGATVNTFVGRRLIRFWEGFIDRIPFIRGIYGAVKQLTEAIFVSGGRSFSRVVLIEYPRKGIRSIGFVTGKPGSGISKSISQENLLNIFIPSTPNPTTGYYLIMPENDCIPVDLSVEDAFRLIISGGLSTPEGKQENTAPPLGHRQCK